MKITGGPNYSEIEVSGDLDSRVSSIGLRSEPRLGGGLAAAVGVYLDEIDVVAFSTYRGRNIKVRIKSDSGDPGRFVHIASEAFTQLIHEATGKPIPYSKLSLSSVDRQLVASFEVSARSFGKHGYVSEDELLGRRQGAEVAA